MFKPARIIFISVLTLVLAVLFVLPSARPLIAPAPARAVEGSSRPTVYYVDNNSAGGPCSDSNLGTKTEPWCSIKMANSELRAGDTVYIRGGTYQEGIKPDNSGASGRRITYSNYDNEDVTIADASYGIHLNGKSYITIHGIDFHNLNPFFVLKRASHNFIEYCTFTHSRTYVTWYGAWIYDNSQYNWVHHCTMSENGFMDNQDHGTILDIGNVEIDSDNSFYNLIEDNIMYSGGHHVFGLASSYNVVRNNYFHNEVWASCPRPGGLCGNRDTITEGYGAGWNLWEGNRFGFAGLPPDDYGTVGTTVSSPHNIIRLNSYYHNGASGIEFSHERYSKSDYNHVYNNTIYNNGYLEGVASYAQAGIFFVDGGLMMTIPKPKLNVLKNNIFYNNKGGAIGFSDVSRDDQIIENNWEEAGDPFFVDDESAPDPFNPNIPDFNLQLNSPCIDTGGSLTQTENSGDNDTLLAVNDASYFQDGWSIDGVESDWIAVGTVNNTVQISSINYDTNTITLSSPITWNNNDNVWLYKNSDGTRVLHGSTPDIGAYEYTGSIQPTPTPIPGDANGDGRVDSEDFALLVEDYLGEPVHNTDFNSDSRVDSEDFAILQTNYLK